MKINKIRIKDKWYDEIFKYVEERGEGVSILDMEIELVNYEICNINGFRRLLHIIVDIEDNLKNKDEIHKKISCNDFTLMFFIDVLEAI